MSHSFALGASLGWLRRADYGVGESERFFIEPLIHSYFATPLRQFFLRPSAFLSYVWAQPEMPASLRVEETDLYLGLGLGFVYDWVLVPSFTVGTQFIHRNISLQASDPVTIETDLVSTSERHIALYVQGGIGVSLFSGDLVLEPFYRQRFFLDDQREGGAYGLESSYALF